MKHDIDDFDTFEAPPSNSRSFMQVLWQRKAFVILGALIGLAGGFLWYTQKTTIYATTAAVLVHRILPNNPNNAGPGNISEMMQDYMHTQIVVIRSPRVLSRALDNPDYKLKELATFEGIPNQLAYLSVNLIAMRDTEKSAGAPNNIINLTFRGPVADDCPVIVNAVIKSYQDELDDIFADRNIKTMKELEKQIEKLRIELNAINAEHKAFRHKHKIIYTTGEKGYNPVQDLVARLENKKADLMIAKGELDEEIKEFKVAIEEGRGLTYGYLLRKKLGLDSKYADEVKFGESELAGLKQLKAKAEQDFGPKHPAVLSLDKQLETMRKHFDDIRPAEFAAGRDPVENLMSQIEQMRKKLQSAVDSIEKQLTTNKQEAIRLAEIELEEFDFRTKKVFNQQFLDNAMKNLQALQLLAHANAAGKIEVHTLAPPGNGGKVYPVLTQDMALGTIFGLMVGICLAYVADFADKSFRSPDEIRKQLGLPLVGHIPFFLPDADTAKRRASGEATIEPMLCCYFKPKSLDSEAYRAVRTSMFFNTQGQGHKIIQVTSPNKGDGKSLLISNLAITTAQSGKRVLLIDADCRRPRQHKVFNIGNSAGLVNILTGQASPTEVVQESCVPGLSLIPSGPVPPNPSELLVSPRFKETLDFFREQYDYVFVDTPPLLAVTDPCVVAGNVDGLFLAIRLTRRGRPDAERAREILQSLKVRTYGIVVNGVTRTNAGIYSSQAYDYTDKYMDYEDDEDKAYYYADDDAEAEAAAKGK